MTYIYATIIECVIFPYVYMQYRVLMSIPSAALPSPSPSSLPLPSPLPLPFPSLSSPSSPPLCVLSITVLMKGVVKLFNEDHHNPVPRRRQCEPLCVWVYIRPQLGLY